MSQIFQIIDRQQARKNHITQQKFQSSWPYAGTIFATMNYFESMAFTMEFNECDSFRWSQTILTVGKSRGVKVKRWTHTNCSAHHLTYGDVQLHAHLVDSTPKEMLHLHLYNPKIKCWLQFIFIHSIRTAYTYAQSIRCQPTDCDFWFWYLRRKKADCVQHTSSR